MAGALQPRNGSLQYMLHSAPLLILALVLSIVGNVFQLIGPALRARHRCSLRGKRAGRFSDSLLLCPADDCFLCGICRIGIPGTTDRAADQPAYGTVDAWGSFLQTDALACEVL